MSLDEMQGVYVIGCSYGLFFFFSSRRRHTIYWRDCISDVCSSDLGGAARLGGRSEPARARRVRPASLKASRASPDRSGPRSTPSPDGCLANELKRDMSPEG